MRLVVPVYVCALLLGASSCQKNGPPPASTEIFGDWQWVSSVGGFTGKEVVTPASTGSGRTYRFHRDSTFVQCIGGPCTDRLPFRLRVQRSQLDGNPHLILTLPRRIYLAPPDTGFHLIQDYYTVQEVSGVLRLAQETPDGYLESYARK